LRYLSRPNGAPKNLIIEVNREEMEDQPGPWIIRNYANPD